MNRLYWWPIVQNNARRNWWCRSVNFLRTWKWSAGHVNEVQQKWWRYRRVPSGTAQTTRHCFPMKKPVMAVISLLLCEKRHFIPSYFGQTWRTLTPLFWQTFYIFFVFQWLEAFIMSETQKCGIKWFQKWRIERNYLNMIFLTGCHAFVTH